MSAVVKATGLEKRFAGLAAPAVAGIDFAIVEGECFGFLGPNGAGKTTTMRMISCRARRSSGLLEVLGRDPSVADRAVKRDIGVVPQETNLDQALSVQENLVVHARYYDLRRDEARRRAEELLEFVQLADRAEWNVDALSGGMKRRLLVARGLINRPRLLILDEPTTGLDPQARHLVWEKLRELRRRGVTLVLTTHYMEEATQLCDRLVIMHGGRILVEGAPTGLISQHVAPQVVEVVARDHDVLEAVAAAAAPHADGHEVVGDRVVLHAGNGSDVLERLARTGLRYESATIRNATLEDVFLKLTGRSLLE